ncbi:MAG: Trk system potassium transporter TrkA [Acidimicrobiia bacterium]|nr:Trk system potassium transporter TrkA [Acidimicrobiia bacterium]
MRVVIVGAGHDGSYLAERLVAEGQEVVIIEADAEKATRIQERLDVLTVEGNGASPAVLRRAGVDGAGLFLAVTDNDGANVLACRSAKALGVRRTVARVEDPDLREVSPGLGVDVVVDARVSTAQQAARLAEHAGVTEYADFAGGRLSLVAGVVTEGSPAAGKNVLDLRQNVSGWHFILAAVVRGDKTEIGRGETRIEAGDHVVVMVEATHVPNAIEMFGIEVEPISRVVILGGTRISEMTAELLLASGYEVLIVEEERERAALMARRCPASILQADPTDPDFLTSLRLGHGDVVVGLSGHDELNLMGCLMASAVGAPKTIARFGHRSVAGLLRNVGIDATLSSRVAVANMILQFVRRDNILSVATVKDTDAEALEMELTADSPSIGVRLIDLGLPRDAVLGGIARGDQVIVPKGDTVLEVEDHVVIFAKSEAIDAVEKILLP